MVGHLHFDHQRRQHTPCCSRHRLMLGQHCRRHGRASRLPCCTRAGVPLTMVPLEVTHTALASPAVLERMFHKGAAVSISPFKSLVELLLTFFDTTYRWVAGGWGWHRVQCTRTELWVS